MSRGLAVNCRHRKKANFAVPRLVLILLILEFHKAQI